MPDEIEYVPRFPKQLSALTQADHSKTLFVGGVGFGKTKTLGDFIGWEMSNYPEGMMIVAGATKPSLKLSTIPKTIKEFQDRKLSFEYKDYTGECFFPNGSWFKFQSLDVARDELEGSELSALAFDEITGCDEDKVGALLHRVRKMSPCARAYQMAQEFGTTTEGMIKPGDPGWWDYSRRVLMCGNPPAPGHWLEGMFIGDEAAGRKGLGPIVQASTYENRLLPKDYIADLERRHIPGSFSHKRMMLGLFGIAAEGAVYDIFQPSIHMIDEKDVPANTVAALGAIDLGCGGAGGDPFVFVAGLVGSGGELYICEEYYSTDGLVLADHARNIRARYRGGPIFCDYGSRARLELKALGIRTRAANKDILMGIQCVRSRLANRKLFIVRGRCPFLLSELPHYRWKEGDKQVAGNGDHVLDAVRYMVAGLDLPQTSD